ncbi:MAG: hypothetical protein JWN41_687 [Thermoleophilia bacterium]|nr:hypothetical protein [Thermoleophilia bacterium]
MSDAELAQLRDDIAAVSPAWRARVFGADEARDGTDARRAPATRALGVEAIREGWLLHRGQSRLVRDASPDLELLIGDWCYAAGLCHVADHGSLDDVAVLADLVTDISLTPGTAVAELEARWSSARAALGLGEV